MKAICVILLAASIILAPVAMCEEEPTWFTAPMIRQAYELAPQRLYIEWTGSAPIYQIFVDGACVASVIVNNAVISIKKGTHLLAVYPVNEASAADTKLSLDLNFMEIGGGIGLDLGALGLDPKKLVAGIPSESLFIDYTEKPIFNAIPDKLSATTDAKDRVLLSFLDRHGANQYSVTIKVGNDVNYVRFNTGMPDSSTLITRTNDRVTLILDQEYLQRQGCLVPQLGEKYTFSIQLRAYATNMLTGEPITSVMHESRVSTGFDYTPIAAWKAAPIITYASQTADGQITLRWDHDNCGIDCSYSIAKVGKTFGFKTSEELVGLVQDTEFVLNDLLNGNYCFLITPVYQNEEGAVSNEANVDVKNEWVAAPTLNCEQMASNQVKLAWTAPASVQKYHITVHVGNNESLLRFVDLDYSKYADFDVEAVPGSMEYTYIHDKDFDLSTGLKIKFEIYGTRKSADGVEQKSATSTQTIVLH